MASNKTDKKMTDFRKWIDSEIIKHNRNRKNVEIKSKPSMSFVVDKKTDKLILHYYIPVVDDTSKRNGIRKIKKQKYLKRFTLDNYKTAGFDVKIIYDFILEEFDSAYQKIFVDESTLRYWIDKFTSPIARRGVTKIPSPKTRYNEKHYLEDYYKWLEQHQPLYLNLWQHNSNACRNVLIEYLQYRAVKSLGRNSKDGSEDGGGWSNTTIFNSYRIIRNLFNWIALNEEGFVGGRLSNLPIDKPKPILNSFTNIEFQKIMEFMEAYKDDSKFDWFIPILRLMLVTGCRISEVAKMKINELNFLTTADGVEYIKWVFRGKGGYKRVINIDSSTLLNDIEKAIYDDKGNLRTDKEYVFHRRYYRDTKNQYGTGGMGLIENLNEPYSISGIGHKFKKMVSLLKLNPKLTPHSTRRFFITEKLLETNGSIPIVALLVGHRSFSMVNHYQRHNEQSEMLDGIRNTLDFGKVIKRKKGIKYGKTKKVSKSKRS